MSTSATQVRRVLVVLPNWLGDLVMTMPLVDLLGQAGVGTVRPLEIMAVVRRAPSSASRSTFQVSCR